MKKIVTNAFVLLLCTACQQGQDKTSLTDQRKPKNDIEVNIYRSGDSMLAAFKRKDWIKFVGYNNPNMTKRMGGPEAFASFVNMQMKQIPDSAIKDISLGKILQVVKTPKDQQCIVQQDLLTEQRGIQLNKKTYLIGESLDNGINWTFFDASTKTGLTPKDIKPDLSPELQIPAVVQDKTN